MTADGTASGLTLAFLNLSPELLQRVTVNAGSFQSYDDEFIEPRGSTVSTENLASQCAWAFGREDTESFVFSLWWMVGIETSRASVTARFSLEPGFPGRARVQPLPSLGGSGWLVEPEFVRVL